MKKLDFRQIVAGLVVVVIVVMGSGRAEAEIIISQTTVQPTGDPQAILDFKIALLPDTSLATGDVIELFSVHDINPDFNPTYRYTLANIVYDSYMTVNEISIGDGTTDITLTYNQSPSSAFTNPGSSSALIGDLFVLTTADFPPPPDSPILDPINYTSQVGTDTYMGITTPTVIPEPTSLTLIGLGFSSAWLLARRRGERKRGVSRLGL